MDDLDSLKRGTDMVSLLESYGVKCKAANGEHHFCCISHDDRNPSAQVYIGKNGIQQYHCKSCGAGGSVIDVVMTMDGVTEGEAIKRLKANGFDAIERVKPTRQANPKNLWQHGIAPEEKPDMTHYEFGSPVQTWRYNTATGQCLGYVARYHTKDGGKEYRPYTFGSFSENVSKEWRPRIWTAGRRPLYGLDLLAERPDAKVVICEGEKATDAARHFLPAMVCICWPGGANAVANIDFIPLTERDVLLIPDADKAGIDAMQNVGDILSKLGCEIRMVDTADMPKGWDLADALNDGWDSAKILEWARPRISPFTPTEHVTPPPQNLPQDIPDDYPGHEYYLDGTIESTFSVEPTDLFTKFTAPPLQRGILPPVIEDHIFDLAEVINTDPAFGALTAISAVAGLLDDRIKIKIRDGYYESARLWTMCCGEPSTKKSPIMDAVLHPLNAIVSRVAKEDAKIKQRQEIIDARHAAKIKEYTKASIDSDSHDVLEPIPPERLERRRIKCDVLTREGMERALQDMPSGVYIHNDEISAFIGSMDAYKASGVCLDRPLWLRAFGGGPMQIDKVGAGSYLIENWSATISGGIQPAKLSAIASRMDDDGLLQRFLIITSSRNGGQGIDRARNAQYATAWRDVLEHLSEVKPCNDYVKMSPGAYALYVDAVSHVYRIINSKMISRSFTTAMGKWEGVIARVMLCFHAVDCAIAKQHPANVEVSESTAALTIGYMMDHLLPHMVSFYEDGLGESESSSIARLIAGHIVAEHLTEISTTKLHKNGPSRWRNGTEYIKVESVNRLVEYGWIVPVGGINNATKRPTRFLVNPHVHALYANFADQERERIKEAREIGAKIRAGTR